MDRPEKYGRLRTRDMLVGLYTYRKRQRKRLAAYRKYEAIYREHGVPITQWPLDLFLMDEDDWDAYRLGFA